jgi:hypothetical protein
MPPLTFRNPQNRFDIPGDKRMFDRIVEDMLARGGALAPSEHWNWNLGEQETTAPGYSDELYEKNYSHLERMLDPWVGVTGMKSVEKSAVDRYDGFLRAIDHLGLLPADGFAHTQSNRWRETDLGSVLDANLISIFAALRTSEAFAVCEVGGGYGRLAEVFLQLCPRIHYVLIDAVPGSLMYAYLYLKAQFPELAIGSYYAGEAYDRKYNCYIMPAWHADALPDQSFEVCVNIESMQEMAQNHVDHYLRMFDRLTVARGWIYLSNARNYVFKGSWNIPPHWETHYLNNTPRSWSPDHPTHILRKGEGDHSLARIAHEGALSQQAEAWRIAQLFNEELHPGGPPAATERVAGLAGRLQRMKRKVRRNLLRIADRLQ